MLIAHQKATTTYVGFDILRRSSILNFAGPTRYQRARVLDDFGARACVGTQAFKGNCRRRVSH